MTDQIWAAESRLKTDRKGWTIQRREVNVGTFGREARMKIFTSREREKNGSSSLGTFLGGVN